MVYTFLGKLLFNLIPFRLLTMVVLVLVGLQFLGVSVLEIAADLLAPYLPEFDFISQFGLDGLV